MRRARAAAQLALLLHARRRARSPTAAPPCPGPLSLQNSAKRVRCPCGRAICLGHHNYTTSSAAQAAQPQVAEEPAYADPDCVSTDLVGRHQVGRSLMP